MRPKREIPPVMSLDEELARRTGEYPSRGNEWEIPFRITLRNGRARSGFLLANMLRLPVGLPGSFLVYSAGRFRGVIKWTAKGWTMDRIDPDLVYLLGQFIELWYQ